MTTRAYLVWLAVAGCTASHRAEIAGRDPRAPGVASARARIEPPARRRSIRAPGRSIELTVPGGPRQLVLEPGVRVEQDGATWRTAVQPIGSDLRAVMDDGPRVRFVFEHAIWEADGFTGPLRRLVGGPDVQPGDGPGRAVATVRGHLTGVPTAPPGSVVSAAFVDERAGVALLDPGVLHLTEDGGASWTTCAWGRAYVGVSATARGRYAFGPRPGESEYRWDAIAADCSVRSVAGHDATSAGRVATLLEADPPAGDPRTDPAVRDALVRAELATTTVRGFAGADRSRVLLYGTGHTGVEDLASGAIEPSSVHESTSTCDGIAPFGPAGNARVCPDRANAGEARSERQTVFVWDRDGVSRAAMHFAGCDGPNVTCVADADASHVACTGRCDPAQPCGAGTLVCERRRDGSTVQHAYGDRFDTWEPLGFVQDELVMVHRAAALPDVRIRVGEQPEMSITTVPPVPPSAEPQRFAMDTEGRVQVDVVDSAASHRLGIFVGRPGSAFTRRQLPMDGDVAVDWCGSTGALVARHEDGPWWFSAAPDAPWHRTTLTIVDRCDAAGMHGESAAGGENIDGWSEQVVDAVVRVADSGSPRQGADTGWIALECSAVGAERPAIVRLPDTVSGSMPRSSALAPGLYAPDRIGQWAVGATRGREQPVRVDTTFGRSLGAGSSGVLLHGDEAGRVWLLLTYSQCFGSCGAVWQLDPTRDPVRTEASAVGGSFYYTRFTSAHDGGAWVSIMNATAGVMVAHDAADRLEVHGISRGLWTPACGAYAIDGAAGALVVGDGGVVVAVTPGGVSRVLAPALELRTCGPHARGDLEFVVRTAGHARFASSEIVLRFALDDGRTCFRASGDVSLAATIDGDELVGTLTASTTAPVRCRLR